MPDPLDFTSAAEAVAADAKILNPIGSSPADPFAEAAGAVASEASVRLKTSVRAGAAGNADQRARAITLAERLRLPVDVVERNLPAAEAKVRDSSVDLDQVRQDHPQLADWLTNPDNATVGNDDLPMLRRIDTATRALSGQDPSGLLRPGFRFEGNAIIEPNEAGTLANRYETVQDYQEEMRRRGDRDAVASIDRHLEAERLEGELGAAANFVAGAAQSLTSTQEFLGTRTEYDRPDAPIVRASQELSPGFWGDVQRGVGGLAADAPLMLAGGPLAEGFAALVRMSGARRAAVSVLGRAGARRATAAAATGAAVQPLAIREGVNAADQDGMANGAMSWLIETAVPGAFGRTGVERFLVKGPNGALADGWRGAAKRLGVERFLVKGPNGALADGWRGAAKRLLTDAGLEASEEAVTEWAHAVHEKASGINPHALDPDQLGRRLAVAGTVGAVAGGAINLPTTVAEKFARDGEEARRATVHSEKLLHLSELLAESKTNGRSPERVADMLEKTLSQSDRFAYVDGADFRDAYEDPAAAAAALGVADEYAQALATGGQMQIPTTKLVQRAAEDEPTAALLQRARRSPVSKNAAEAAAFEEQAPDQVKKLENQARAAAEAVKGAPSATAELQAVIEGQLLKTGQEATTASTNARIMASTFAALGKRSGKDPGELYRMYLDGRIRKVLPKLMRGEKFDLVDAMLERVRSGDVPSDSDINGPTLTDFLRAKGLRDLAFAGELTSLRESDQTRKPGEKSLVRDDGITLDDAAELAAEAGYLPARDVNALLRALDDEIRGGKATFIPGNADPNQQAVRESLDSLVRALESAGVDPLSATNAQAREALAKMLEEDEGQTLEQGIAPRDDRLDMEAMLRQWRKATGDRTPVGGDKAFAELAAEADEVDAANGKSYQQPKGKGAGPRGSLVFGKGRAFTIKLFQSENLSTFTHESGHLFLEIMGDLATAEGAAPDLVADYAAMRAWFGKNAEDIRKQAIDLAEDAGAPAEVLYQLRAASDEEIAKVAEGFRSPPKDGTAGGYLREAMHEYFARGFEAYLMDGKAPVPSLRSAFAKLKAWMTAVYRTVATLRVQLTPEIRDVFDRLVAIEDEVDAAEERAGTTDIMPASAFEDPAEYEAYRTAVQASVEHVRDGLAKELIGDYRKELAKAWAEQRAEIREDVAREVDSRPVYLAIAALQRGQLPDGTTLPDSYQGAKLDRDELVREFGEAILAKLPGPGAGRANRGAYMYADEGGLPANTVARAWGFADGANLIEAMIVAPDRDSLIATTTTAKMRELHPDPAVDGSLVDRADRAIAGDLRGELLAREMRALGARTGETPAPIEVLKQVARGTIARQRARDLAPERYRVAAAQASRRATEAAGRQEWGAAFTAKQQEALNLELYRAARDAVEAGEKGRAYLRKFDTLDARQRLGKLGGWDFVVYREDGSEVDSFDKVEHARDLALTIPGATYRRTNGYLEQIDTILEGYSLRRPSNRALRRKDAFRKWLAKQEKDGEPLDIDPRVIDDLGEVNWNDLTVEQQGEVIDAVKVIAHRAALKGKLLKARRDSDMAAAQAAGAASITANAKPVPASEYGDTPAERAADMAGRFIDGQRKDAFLLRAMDGYEDAGVMWGLIQLPRNEAATEEETRNLVNAQLVDEAFRTWRKAGKDAGQPKGLGWARRPIPGTRLRLTLEHRISMALNWGHAEGRRRILRHLEWEGYDATDVQAVLDSLDAADMGLVSTLVRIINSHWSDVAALEQRMTGLAPEKVAAIPFSTTDRATGKVTWHVGGYYPLKYDPEKSKRGGDKATEVALKENLGAAGARGQTRRSHTKQRVEDVKGLAVDLSLDVAGSHLSEVVHDLTHREMVRDQTALLKDGTEIANAIIDRHGVRALKQLVQTTGAIATRDVTPDNWITPFIRMVRRGNTAATFTYQLASALMNLTGVMNTLARVGPLRTLEALKIVTSDAYSMDWSGRWVQDKSKMMKIRGGNNVREVSEALREVGHLSGLQKMVRIGYIPMQKVVQLVDTVTWIAAYNQALERQAQQYLPARATGAEAEAIAIDVADQTVLDTQGSGRIADLSAMQRGGETAKLFTMFFGYFNVQQNLIREQLGQPKADSADWIRAATIILTVGPLATVMTNLIKAALRGDERKEDAREMAIRMAKEQVSSAAGLLVGVRELSGAVDGFDYSGPASLSAVGSASRTIQQGMQGEVDAGLIKAAIGTAGSLTGAPGRVANQVIDAWMQFENGEGAGRALRTALFGKALKDH